MSSSSSANTYFSYSNGMRFSAAVLAMSVLYGCGGGGSDSPEAPATQLPEERPITLPITEMPTSSHSGFKQEAFVRLNEARIAAGVSALKQNVELDAAAQAHAEYLVGNYVTGHYEDPAKPLFTGISFLERAAAQGYNNQVRTEIITYFFAQASGADHINVHLTSVYHLAGALDPSSNEVGIGTKETLTPGRYIPSSFTLGTTDQRLQPVEAIWVWPTNGATGMPRAFLPATEIPNPLADIALDESVVVGAPIMFCSSKNNYAPLEVRSIKFSEVGSAQIPQAWVLHHPDVEITNQPGFESKADANLVTYANSHCIFILPKEKLAADRTYTVGIEASHAGFDFNKTWSFTTIP